jgi:hypothetical protein
MPGHANAKPYIPPRKASILRFESNFESKNKKASIDSAFSTIKRPLLELGKMFGSKHHSYEHVKIGYPSPKLESEDIQLVDEILDLYGNISGK